MSRAVGPHFFGPEDSQFFHSFNVNKRSLTLDLMSAESAMIGLQLNLSKCEVWWPSRSEAWDIFPAAVRRIDTDGVEFLGAGIGSSDFINSITVRRVEKASTLHDLIPEMDDPQCEMSLLRNCAGVCKVTHALWTSPPCAISAATASFDNSLRGCLEKVSQTSIGDSSWSQASLPISDGGLGLRSASSSAAAAFVASCAVSVPHVRRLLSNEHITLPGMAEAIGTLKTQGCANVEDIIAEGQVPSLQRRLTNPITAKQRQDLLDSSAIRDKARLKSLAADHAGAWLLAVPMPMMGLAIPAREFRVLLRHTLGLQIYSAPRTCPACNSARLDVWGSHSVICGSGGDRISRHNSVRDALYHIAEAAAFSPILEIGHIIPGSQRRPGDITIPDWSGGLPAAIDVTVTSPLQQNTILGAATECGVAARLRQQAKDDAALGLCEAAGVSFLPVAVETFGAWGDVARATIASVARRWADRRGEDRGRAKNWIFQKLSVALQRGNASMLLSRSPVMD